MSEFLSRLRNDPIGFLRRAFYKAVVAPLRYGKKNGEYHADKYWRDRFSKYGMSLKSVGDEGLSEEQNAVMYRQAANTFLAICRQENVDFPKVRVLEIGCGNGFYTQLLQEQGVRDYVGLDITDVFFPELTKRFPGYTFIRGDVTIDRIAGKFDLILMIDVIEHIVGNQALEQAMSNVQTALDDDGLFLLAPIVEKGKRSLFYVRFWTQQDIKMRLPDCHFHEPIPFRYSHLLVAKKLCSSSMVASHLVHTGI